MKTINALLLFLCVSGAVYSQQQTTIPPVRGPHCRPCIRRVVKPAPVATTAPQSSPEFFVGEAKVDVTKDETVVRLAMAQHGSVLIELPANDSPRYIIPGDPEMATVDQKALERNKRAIVVRPGTQFVPPARNDKRRIPAATVTAQMRSGLVVTFLFYPVEDLAQNVHRCVLSYNRDEVVARRRAVGLPVNLDTEARGELTAQSAAPTSISVENQTQENKERTVGISPCPSSSLTIGPTVQPSRTNLFTPLVIPVSPFLKSAIATADQPKEATVIASVRDALEQAIKNPKQFKQWTRPFHGLALSTLDPPINHQPYALAVVAIKNTFKEPLKLTPDGPDLVLEMVNEAGKPLNITSIKRLHSEPSEPSGLIHPNGTVYYAIAYLAPVLGTQQRIKLSVAQSNAADEPASIMLAKSGK